MEGSVRLGVDLQADRGPEIIRITTAVGVLTTLVVAARFTSRRLQKAQWNASDYTVALGLVGCWALTGAVISSVPYGLGKHVEVVPLADIVKILKVTFISEIFYSITFPIIKISILLLYRSLFPGRVFAIVTNLVGLFVIVWGIALLLVSIFSCRPIHGFWDITIPSVCINTRKFFIGNSVPNICADVFILTLPVNKVWHLKMSMRSKIMVSGLFLLGGFVCVVSGVRLYFLLQLDEKDISWSYFGVAVWSSVELNVAVISACLPTIRPLIQNIGQIFTTLRSSIRGSSKSITQEGNSWEPKAFGTSPTSSQPRKDAFQSLSAHPLDDMSMLERGESRELESVGGEAGSMEAIHAR